MKKLLGIIPIILISLLLFSCNEDSSNPVNGNDQVKKKWTYIFYNDADFTNAYNPTNDFAARMKSNSNLDVLILEDVANGPSRYLYVESNSNVKEVKTLEEQNMGHKNSLSDLIKFAKENYPAERYILALYNHGSGAMGACVDITSNDMLSMYEIHSALSENDGVDFLLFTAPCLMGAFESVYEVRDDVDYYIGSENTSGFMFWFEVLPEMNNKIKSDPEISSEEFAKFIIDQAYEKNLAKYPEQTADHLTMSAVKTENVAKITEQFSEITEYYYSNMNKFKDFCSQEMNNIRSYYNWSVDFYDFLEKLKEFESSENIKTKIANVQNLITQSVVHSCCGLNQFNSHGVTLYFPYDYQYGVSYMYTNGDPLFFLQETKWGELVTNTCTGSTSTNKYPIPEHIN